MILLASCEGDSVAGRHTARDNPSLPNMVPVPRADTARHTHRDVETTNAELPQSEEGSWAGSWNLTTRIPHPRSCFIESKSGDGFWRMEVQIRAVAGHRQSTE